VKGVCKSLGASAKKIIFDNSPMHYIILIIAILSILIKYCNSIFGEKKPINSKTFKRIKPIKYYSENV
jgi:hypothetical protein